MAANFVALAGNTVSGLIVARVVGPERMGRFMVVMLVLPYAAILLAGVPNGLNRELPLLYGQGREQEAKELASAAWWWVRWVGLALSLLSACVTAFVFFLKPGPQWEAWLAFSCGVAFTTYTQYVRVLYRSRNKFIDLGHISVAMAVLGVISVVLPYIHPWYGFLGRWVLLSMCGFGLLFWFRPIRLRPSFRGIHLVRLMKVGVPLFGIGYLAGILGVLDQTLIVKELGAVALGLYTPAVQIRKALLVLVTSVNQMIYPKLTEQFGRTGTVRSLLVLTFGPTLVLAVGLLPVFIVGWWLVDPFVRFVLPEYVAGIPAARWVVVLMYVRSLWTPTLVYQTVNRVVPIMVMIAVGIGTGFMVVLWLLKRGWGLSAAPAGCTAGYGVIILVASVGIVVMAVREGHGVDV